MRVGILGGTGPAGKALAARLASVGIEAVVGSRDSARATYVASEIRAAWPERDLAVSGASNGEAAELADTAVVATVWDAAVATAAEHAEALAGKVVISMGNSLLRVGREFHALVPARGSVAAGIQAVLPRSRVAAAFQHLPAKELGEISTPLDADVLVCSDFSEAIEETSRLVERIPNLVARDAGGLESAAAIEAMTAVLLTMNLRYKTRTSFRITGIPE